MLICNKKRIEYAKAAGYESYVDFAYSEEYPKDYTKEDREKFYEYTAEYIVPLYRELYDLFHLLDGDDIAADIDLSEEEILSIVREDMADFHPELVEAYDYDTADGIMNMLSDYRIPDSCKDKYDNLKQLMSAVDRDAIIKLLED